MSNKKTIAIVNDPKVTLGSISSDNLKQYYAWEVDWSSLGVNNDYIILGGHMGAYDTKDFPYLSEEKKWLNKIIPLGTKVLGICLGAQLIADAMGGKAYLSEEIEFGFKNLNFHKNYELLDVYNSLKVFAWHRDTFTLPQEAELIASTDFPQIFKIYNTYAFQFHPEITIDLYDDWYDSDISKKELSNFNTEKTRNYLVENEFFISNKMNNFYSAWKSLKL
jgi:GMP synthase (glutamine-hydrolysing)